MKKLARATSSPSPPGRPPTTRGSLARRSGASTATDLPNAAASSASPRLAGAPNAAASPASPRLVGAEPGTTIPDGFGATTTNLNTRRACTPSPRRSRPAAAAPTLSPRGARLLNSREDEHFKTRFSVHRIRSIYSELSSVKKLWIQEAGLGALLNLSEVSVPVKLVKWIMEQMRPQFGCFMWRGRVINFNRSLICKILGLPSGILPLKLSGKVDDVKQLREVYKDGKRAKIMKCIDVVLKSTGRESFVRAFMLLALSSVFCPGTGNYVEMKYLHSLTDISLLGYYDWAGLVLDDLMEEVTKYQELGPERLQYDHQIGGCLIILAIAYMDHLDLPLAEDGTHQVNYNLPRICNVSNADFDFVMKVDYSRVTMIPSWGKLKHRPFAQTPYAYPKRITPPQQTPLKSVAQDSVQSTPPEDPFNFVSSLDGWQNLNEETNDQSHQIPAEYQKIAAEFTGLFAQDVAEYTSSITSTITDKIKDFWKIRTDQMLSKMAEFAESARMVGGVSGPSTSGVVAEPKPSTCASGDSPPPRTEVHSQPNSDDGGAEATSDIGALNANQSGTYTHEKKNRKKRAAITLNQATTKKLKMDGGHLDAYKKLVANRIMKKPTKDLNGKSEEEPPFVQIAGFFVSYEDFYKSFKPRGEINNAVMTLWSYQFNIDQSEAWQQDNTIIKKYAFSAVISYICSRTS